jgi:hypothetical protein
MNFFLVGHLACADPRQQHHDYLDLSQISTPETGDLI